MCMHTHIYTYSHKYVNKLINWKHVLLGNRCVQRYWSSTQSNELNLTQHNINIYKNFTSHKKCAMPSKENATKTA